MTAADAMLVDTNVLIHSAISASPFHHQARTVLQELHRSGRELWVSRQVLREYLAALSRPQSFTLPQPWAILSEDVGRYEQQFRVADEGARVTAKLRELGATFAVGGRQVHDANLVATMLVEGIPALLTFNVADFQRFASLIQIVEPPRVEPG